MLRGILPVIPTLFTDQNVIDPEATLSVLRFALDSGAHGIVFPGVASEYNFLSLEERAELIAAVAAEVNGRVPIVGGASAASAEDAIAAGSAIVEHGIRDLMIMAPVGLGDDIDAHKRFFQKIASALDDVEIILQNAPSPIGAGLPADSIAAIVQSCPAIKYCKEETLPSGPVISAIRSMELPQLNGVLGGGGARYLIDELNRGALGAIPAVELTDIHVALYDAHTEGNSVRAREIYRATLPLLVSQMIYRMRFTKYALKKRGIADRLHVRAPLPELDCYSKADIDVMLDDLSTMFNPS